jgi:hypothetical protein
MTTPTFTATVTDSVTGQTGTKTGTFTVSSGGVTYQYSTSSNTGNLPPSGNFDSYFPTVANAAAYVIADVWNPTSAFKSQVVSANNPGQWQVVANIAAGNTAVLSYPDIQVTVTNTSDQATPFSGFKSLASTFAHQMPSDLGTQGSGDDYEAAYDIWLGAGSNNYAQEVMIWQDTHNQVPAGSNTGKTYTDASGVVYQIWTESGNNPVTFKRSSNVTSGSVDLLALFKFMIANGYTTMTGVNQIDYGFELCSTSGKTETFTVTGFSLTAS